MSPELKSLIAKRERASPRCEDTEIQNGRPLTAHIAQSFWSNFFCTQNIEVFSKRRASYTLCRYLLEEIDTLMLHRHCMKCWCCTGIAWNVDAARALHEMLMLHGHCMNCCCCTGMHKMLMLHGHCMNCWCCTGIAWKVDAARALHELMLRGHCMNWCCTGIAWIDAARALHELLLRGHCMNWCCTGIAWIAARTLH